MIQSDEFPPGKRFWNFKVISSGGIDVKLMLYIFCSLTTETNLPNLLFKGYPPFHCHSLHPLVCEVQFPPSNLK